MEPKQGEVEDGNYNFGHQCTENLLFCRDIYSPSSPTACNVGGNFELNLVCLAQKNNIAAGGSGKMQLTEF